MATSWRDEFLKRQVILFRARSEIDDRAIGECMGHAIRTKSLA
ncbi:hypothetical protein PCLA_09f0106 [Pseudomonas citronellolis]|nr:hypothetical protein PCLA_09f0106 [Pseudomonas citronellolis]